MLESLREAMSSWWTEQNFVRKYFLVPQALNSSPPPMMEGSFINKHRKLLSLAIPIVVIEVIWWSYMSANNLFYLFNGDIGANGKPRHLISVTMIFGSMIAGATSEGGAAVAFPVLTLVMGVAPSIARDFGFMIQSVGMSAASFSILFMNVKLEYKSLLYCTIGGTAGVIFGLEQVAPRLTPPFTKMYFVSIWFAFAIALYWLNFYHSRKVYEGIPYWDCGRIFPHLSLDLAPVVNKIDQMWQSARTALGCPVGVSPSTSPNTDDGDAVCHPDSPDSENTTGDDIEVSGTRAVTPATSATSEEESPWLITFNWKAFFLLCGGFIGGIFSAMGGSGLDICSFSILTLLFCVSERVATPTSIVLMAVNSIVAFMWRDLYADAIDPESWRMWLCCVPIVCIGAPLGALMSSHWHRLVIAFLVVGIDVAQLVGAIYVIRPWTKEHTPYPVELCVNSAMLMVGSAIAFSLLAFGGSRLLATFSSLPLDVQQREERLHAESHGASTPPPPLMDSHTVAKANKLSRDDDNAADSNDDAGAVELALTGMRNRGGSYDL